MKYKTNLKIIKTTVCVLFFSIATPSFGQDLIKGAVDYLLCDTSIVRGTKYDTVMIYNHTNNTSTFMQVNPHDMWPWVIYIEPIYVNDFEYLGGYIFFCGYLKENEKKGVVGYFKYDQFPNCNIYYHILDECIELKKLDVSRWQEIQGSYTYHVISTGTTTGTRSDFLADVTMFAPGGTVNCKVYFSDDENENFDDVAVTDNKVVVSSRTKVEGLPVVNFWYYKRPHLTGESIFSSNVDIFRIGSPIAETPVFLEHIKTDSLAAVYKESGFNRISMLLIDVTSPFGQIYEIDGDKMHADYPMDIKYKSNNPVFDILACYSGQRDSTFLPPMQIYHVVSGDLSGLSPYGQGTCYTDIYYHIWSIDLWRGSSPQFIASGGAGKLPQLFRFRHNQWNPCTSRFEYNYKNGTLEGIFLVTRIIPIQRILGLNSKEPREKRPIKFSVECGEE